MPFSASHWGRRYKSLDFSGNAPHGTTSMELQKLRGWPSISHLPVLSHPSATEQTHTERRYQTSKESPNHFSLCKYKVGQRKTWSCWFNHTFSKLTFSCTQGYQGFAGNYPSRIRLHFRQVKDEQLSKFAINKFPNSPQLHVSGLEKESQRTTHARYNMQTQHKQPPGITAVPITDIGYRPSVSQKQKLDYIGPYLKSPMKSSPLCSRASTI